MPDPTHADLHRQIGALQADMLNVKDAVREVRADVKQLVAVSEQARGGWKMLAIVGSVGGAVGALVAKMAPKLFG